MKAVLSSPLCPWQIVDREQINKFSKTFLVLLHIDIDTFVSNKHSSHIIIIIIGYVLCLREEGWSREGCDPCLLPACVKSVTEQNKATLPRFAKKVNDLFIMYSLLWKTFNYKFYKICAERVSNIDFRYVVVFFQIHYI